MDDTLQLRLRSATSRLAERRDQQALEENSEDRLRRLARQRVLKEIPPALERLSSAIGEVNDLLSELDFHLELKPSSALYDLEVSMMVELVGSQCDANLVVNVNYAGQVTVLLGPEPHRILLQSAKLWDATRTFFLEALVTFVERCV